MSYQHWGIMKATLFVSLFLFQAMAFGQSTKKFMGDVAKSYIELLPFMYHKKNPDTKKEKENIAKSLYDLQQAFRKAGHTATIKGDNFYPSYKILNSSLENIIMSYEANDYIFSRYYLREVTNICLSCHSQLPKNRYPKVAKFTKKIKASDFSSSYDHGLFLYLFRDYEGAIKKFKKSITENIGKKNYRNIVEKSLLKTLSIYVKNLQDYDSAYQFVKEMKSKKYLYQAIYETLGAWEKDLVNLKSQKTKLLKTARLKKFAADLSEFYSEQNTVFLLGVAGEISRTLLQKPKSPVNAEYLYWLGKIENRFQFLQLNSLGDLYLKQCISSYPKGAYAKRCYQAYEKSIVEGFTGSGGTFLPQEVLNELKALKKTIQ